MSDECPHCGYDLDDDDIEINGHLSPLECHPSDIAYEFECVNCQKMISLTVGFNVYLETVVK